MPRTRSAGRPLLVASLFLLALAVGSPAVAEQGAITLPAGGDATVLTLSLDQGGGVEYSWSADGSVRFKIVSLVGAMDFVDITAQVGSGIFEAPTDGSYVFEFDNPNDVPVMLQWTINRISDFPLLLVAALVGVALVVVAVAVLIWMRRRGKGQG